MRYAFGMKTQITVRIPEECAEFMDGLVAAGVGATRAEVVTRALRREQRRHAAEHDARIYASTADADLDELAAWSSANLGAVMKDLA